MSLPPTIGPHYTKFLSLGALYSQSKYTEKNYLSLFSAVTLHFRVHKDHLVVDIPLVSPPFIPPFWSFPHPDREGSQTET